MKRGNPVDQSNDWRKYEEDEEQDQRDLANGADQWTIHGLVEAHKAVILGLFAGMTGIVLGLKVLDTEHVVRCGDIGKQGCNDERNANDVKPSGFSRMATAGANGAGKGQ